MKKVLIFVVLAATLLLSACGNPTTVSNWGKEVDVSEKPTVESTSAPKKNEELWPSPEDVLPDPTLIFTDGEITPLHSPNTGWYMIQISYGTVEQWYQYVEACKELGFTDIQTEHYNGYMRFRAMTVGGDYEVNTMLGLDDDPALWVTCKWLPRDELKKQWPFPELVIPDPTLIFTDGEIEARHTENPGYCSFGISNGTKGKWTAYVDACKELGFTDITYYSGDGGYLNFTALNDDYEVGIYLFTNTGTGMITCEYIPSAGKR